MHRAARLLAALAVASTATLTAPMGSTVAAPTPADVPITLTAVSEPGESVGQGQNWLFHDGNAQFTFDSTNRSFGLSATLDTAANPADRLNLMVEAPTGRELAVGTYDTDEFENDRQARLWVDFQGRTCNTSSGRVEIRALSFGPDNKVDTLWLSFEQRCNSAWLSMFGELRLGFATDGTLSAPHTVSWPDVDLPGHGAPVPITILDTPGQSAIAGVSLEGANSAAFRIIGDECSGRVPSPLNPCIVSTTYQPTVSGRHGATLVVEREDGGSSSVTLQGTTIAGKTRLDVGSSGGDFVGEGASRHYDPGNADVWARGSSGNVHFWADGADGRLWYLRLYPPVGEELELRQYQAERFATADLAGFSISGGHRGCNEVAASVTLHALELSPIGEVTGFGVSFSQVCDGKGRLQGIAEWRAPVTSVTPPVPDPLEPPDVPSPPMPPGAEPPPRDPFADIAESPFRADIEWLAAQGITGGCGAGRYCPNAPVTREQMASFLVRAFELDAAEESNRFRDIGGSVHRTDIGRLAAAGITGGCGASTFCPNGLVTREQMASFLARALDLPATGPSEPFGDIARSGHRADINRLAAAEITSGCGERRFCPTEVVSREQMAAFLRRGLASSGG